MGSVLREGWEVRKLGDVCDFQNGFAFKSKTFKDFGTPVVRITNIKNEKLDLTKIVYINPTDYLQDLSKYEIKQGDLLIAMSGATTGKIGIHTTNEILLLNQRVGNFKPNKLINRDFLFKYLMTKVEDSLAISLGAAQPNLSTEQIKSFEIPLPPLQEQQKIVAILDEAFGAIDKAKANAALNLQNAKELFESYLQAVFENRGEGWEEKSLEDICTKITDGVHKKPNYTEEGVPFIKINNLTKGEGISFDDVSYISQEDHELYIKRTRPEKNDILITKDGTIGIVKIIDTDIEFSIFVSVALIKPIDKKTTPYLKYILTSPLIQSQIKPKGTALKHLYLKDLRKFVIPIAPINEQTQIVKKLNAIKEETKKLEAIYTQKILDLDELKKAILQKAFSGGLR